MTTAGSQPGSGASRRRRAGETLRRLAIALCCGFAVWFALQCVMSTVATRAVVVTVRGITRGDVIGDGDVAVRLVPDSDAMGHAIGDVRRVVGDVARVDIEAGAPVIRGMTSSEPVSSDGRTTLEVALASAPDSLTPGDTIRLVTTGEGGDATTSKTRARTLADDVLVMKTPPRDDDDGAGLLSADAADGRRTVMVSLTPDEALAVLGAQEASPILAVER
ncbi:flagella basal body P-ring formation protein FlgA [Bifidobacterium sp. 82T24]|uniref:flagella basal body P-ring formation protein FlgA n=1 Tax=Bifidobacterium pluvialisilvae TaxID=2834436 RepID=UPI001C596E47|nr:flagella basal body P-ring formation protein FlgA [Bifidobacterium pluvialisilvae]MBW3088764.1 flagella basal body P-ring formation protein FlgA [Bifidobacterium pluvialisilvae]